MGGGDKDVPLVCEDFVSMVNPQKTTGAHLAEVITTKLEEINLGLTVLQGQAYDGGSNISGHIRGVQTEIRKMRPLAHYVHCVSHRLNLALMNACKVPLVQWFSTSGSRWHSRWVARQL